MNPNNDTCQEEQQENSFRALYEQAKRMWKDLVFEILLEPLDLQSGEIAERRIIDFRNCRNDINKPRNVDGLLPLNELADELPHYNKLLESSNQAIDLIQEECKDRYKITLLRVLYQQIRYEEDSDSEHEYESEPDYEDYSTNTEMETDSDEQYSEPEWEEEWESDSGRETEPDQIIGSSTESEVEYESDWEIDSGRQSESESEWESDVEELHYEEESDPSYEGPSSSDDDESCYEEYPQLVFPYADMLIIGPNETRVSRLDFEAIPWDSPVEATKALLSLIFGDYILATSTPFRRALPEVEGPDREEDQLNPQHIADIVGLISIHYKISQQEVQSIIQTKCAEARNVYILKMFEKLNY